MEQKYNQTAAPADEPPAPGSPASSAHKRTLWVLFCLCGVLLVTVMLTVLLRAPALRVTSVSYESAPSDLDATPIFSSLEGTGGEDSVSEPETSSAPAYTLPLPLNTATAEQLSAALPGIGEVIAERIVAYREEHGGFVSLEELRNVEGIGEKKLEAIRDLLTLDNHE